MANAVNILSMLLPPVAADAGAPAAIPAGDAASSSFASLLAMVSNAQPAPDLRASLQAGIAPIAAPKFPTGPIVPVDALTGANKKDRVRGQVSDDHATPIMAMPTPVMMLQTPQTPQVPLVVDISVAPAPESNIAADRLANVVNASRAPVSPAPTQALPTMKLPAPMPVLATEQTPDTALAVSAPLAVTPTATGTSVKATPTKTQPTHVATSPLHRVSHDARTVTVSASSPATPTETPVVDGAPKAAKAPDRPIPNRSVTDSTPRVANKLTAPAPTDHSEGLKPILKHEGVSSGGPREMKAVMTTSANSPRIAPVFDVPVSRPQPAAPAPANAPHAPSVRPVAQIGVTVTTPHAVTSSKEPLAATPAPANVTPAAYDMLRAVKVTSPAPAADTAKPVVDPAQPIAARNPVSDVVQSAETDAPSVAKEDATSPAQTATVAPPTRAAIVQSAIVAPAVAAPVVHPIANKDTSKQATPVETPRASVAAHDALPRSMVAPTISADATRTAANDTTVPTEAKATKQTVDHDAAQPRAEVGDKIAMPAPQANASAPVAHSAAPHAQSAPASAAPAQVQAVTHTVPAAQAAQTSPAQTTSTEQPLRLPEHASSHNEGPAPEIQALAIRMAAKSAQGNKRFDIRLDPPELGRIDVRLDVDSNGRATAQLAADKPQTLDLLSRDHRQLERALKDAGLDLGGMSFSLKGDERQQAPRTAAQPQTETRTSAPTIASVAPIARWSHVADARVDIRI